MSSNFYDFPIIMHDLVKNPCFIYIMSYISSMLVDTYYMFGILSYVIFLVKFLKCEVMKIMGILLNMWSHMERRRTFLRVKCEIVKIVHNW